MSYSRIMCLVRGDDTDSEVVETAVGLSSGNNGSIRLVHVIVVDYRYSLDATDPENYARAERILQDAERVSGLRGEVRGAILQARSIGPVLVREALDFGAEAIVLSAKVISKIDSRDLDSDSEYLIAYAPCAVVLIRKAEQDFEMTNDHPNMQVEASTTNGR